MTPRKREQGDFNAIWPHMTKAGNKVAPNLVDCNVFVEELIVRKGQLLISVNFRVEIYFCL